MRDLRQVEILMPYSLYLAASIDYHLYIFPMVLYQLGILVHGQVLEDGVRSSTTAMGEGEKKKRKVDAARTW